MRTDLVGQVVDVIIDRIATGTYLEGDALPGEVDLSQDLEVSRLTVREAVKILRDRGVLNVIQGRGTFVAPRHRWTDLESLVYLTAAESSDRTVGLRLVELRRMIEVGAAGLAARNRTDAHLSALDEAFNAMQEAGDINDVDAVVKFDLEFHRQILLASANPFIPAAFAPLEGALRGSRVVTASHPKVRSRAQEHHRLILKAIRSQDEEGAKDAMRAHMTQTRLDLLASTSEEHTEHPLL
ncbi:FadR/GntR family transcriptional regulator [Schaalia vaccimaxillae]|uniref:FadR/GntR family transcriptional regulator n=1 Tax=Schaalia vaccimaxillae TaxID=183916 RepID=UPI0003B547B2|nr:FadR/GntR family transcriptional regulator [Schaalia vaccimaxillae]